MREQSMSDNDSTATPRKTPGERLRQATIPFKIGPLARRTRTGEPPGSPGAEHGQQREVLHRTPLRISPRVLGAAPPRTPHRYGNMPASPVLGIQPAVEFGPELIQEHSSLLHGGSRSRMAETTLDSTGRATL